MLPNYALQRTVNDKVPIAWRRRAAPLSAGVRPPDPFLLEQRGNTEMSRAASKQ